MPATNPADTVQIDIVSDVMCPWCIVGFKQLEQALALTGLGAEIRWHPFELDPDMPPEGQDMIEHVMQKYGSTPEQSAQSRERFTQLGQELGFEFNFHDGRRIYNTFQAHQLLDWAEELEKQHPLKMAMFSAYFTDGKDMSDVDVLVEAATSVGLDGAAASAILTSGARAASVREKQQFWTSRGISGVPSMVFGGKYLMTGAQGADNYAEILRRIVAEAA